MRGREKQAPQAFCRRAAPELRSRPSPTAMTFVLGRTCALPSCDRNGACPNFHERELQAFATEETTR
jgi:hypothetical protein